MKEHEDILEFLAELETDDKEFEAHLKELGGWDCMTPAEAIQALEDYFGE